VAGRPSERGAGGEAPRLIAGSCRPDHSFKATASSTVAGGGSLLNITKYS
jgi:hypothetical protein